MKASNPSNRFRPVAFFLIAIALILTVGFAAYGLRDSDSKNNSGEVDFNSDKADKDTLSQTNPDTLPESQNKPYIPKHINYLTGLECTDSLSSLKPFVFSMDSSAPLYGISSADMMMEIPTESGTTRLLAYITKDQLPTKIGSVSPSRGYIDNLVKYFGGLFISSSYDDFTSYKSHDISGSHVDLSATPLLGYTEYSKYFYTNNELLDSAFAENEQLLMNEPHTMPYNFTEQDKGNVKGALSANNIVIPFSSENETEFTYSSESQAYTLSKNGKQLRDLLNDRKIEFTNVFILFADATTYETSKGTGMVLDTLNGGTGIYFTEGTQIPFTWSTDDDGVLTFSDENGHKLTVNRGRAYVGLMKSSRISDITAI